MSRLVGLSVRSVCFFLLLMSVAALSASERKLTEAEYTAALDFFRNGGVGAIRLTDAEREEKSWTTLALMDKDEVGKHESFTLGECSHHGTKPGLSDFNTAKNLVLIWSSREHFSDFLTRFADRMDKGEVVALLLISSPVKDGKAPIAGSITLSSERIRDLAKDLLSSEGKNERESRNP